MTANINSMMYTGATPWHGLGKKVDHALTSADAIDAAGLQWAVEKVPVKYDWSGKTLIDPEKFHTVRQDNGVSLGVVGSQYSLLQNKTAFSFFDAIVGVKEAMYHTAGALGAGERIWLLAKLPGYVQVTKEDVTEKFLLLSNSHDGSASVQVMFTPIRVVCQNTLNIAIGAASNKFSFRHTANMTLRAEEVQKALGIVSQRFTLFEEAAKALTKTSVTNAGLRELCITSGVIPEPSDKEMSSRAKNIMDEVSMLFEYGMGTNLPGVKGTAWGAFNAIVEYVDHKRGGSPEQRAKGLLYGGGAQIKQSAWNSLLTAVKS